ncbi:DNA-3-methyladenine glycosylase [Lentilactobacillus senioris]|uniref:DNA-3-methyladenine glycosylase n=1 Tax=Lentilactobacillus senioris TaxID=931534 RepID=UPI003D278285
MDIKSAEMAFFREGTTDQIAQKLLGTTLNYRNPDGQLFSGLIVETEAYLGELDSAAHAFKGRHTAANDPLYGPAGTIYIYSIYGHYLFDVATQEAGVPQGVLIRAIQPTVGIEQMQINRHQTGYNLTNGPGKVMAAFGIHDLNLNGRLAQQPPLWIDYSHPKQPQAIIASARIGVENQGDWASKPYRFLVGGNPYVSKIRKREVDLINLGWQD